MVPSRHLTQDAHEQPFRCPRVAITVASEIGFRPNTLF
jgi:hypothetical protein